MLEGSYGPEPPVEAFLNKADGRRKRIFQYQPADELLFRVVNPLVQPEAARAASRWCRSFLPGGGARAAFRDVIADREAASKAALRLDIRDYFNSIDVDDLLRTLPETFTTGAVGALLEGALRDPRVVRAGEVAHGGQKGIMAGTPLAPMLATLYLRDLDVEIASAGVTYARYSDDIVVLAPPDDLTALEECARAGLRRRGLDINERKSSTSRPGEPWDFLGFRYDDGRIGLSQNTVRKLRAKSTRLARALLRWRERTGSDPERTLEAFVRRTNRRLYGAPTERADFSWATWFLPMLSTADGLDALDEHMRREARYAATGLRTARARSRVPHDMLRAAGHLPLVTAYWTLRDQGQPAYDALVSRRTGLGLREPDR